MAIKTSINIDEGKDVTNMEANTGIMDSDTQGTSVVLSSGSDGCGTAVSSGSVGMESGVVYKEAKDVADKTNPRPGGKMMQAIAS